MLGSHAGKLGREYRLDILRVNGANTARPKEILLERGPRLVD